MSRGLHVYTFWFPGVGAAGVTSRMGVVDLKELVREVEEAYGRYLSTLSVHSHSSRALLWWRFLYAFTIRHHFLLFFMLISCPVFRHLTTQSPSGGIWTCDASPLVRDIPFSVSIWVSLLVHRGRLAVIMSTTAGLQPVCVIHRLVRFCFAWYKNGPKYFSIAFSAS